MAAPHTPHQQAPHPQTPHEQTPHEHAQTTPADSPADSLADSLAGSLADSAAELLTSVVDEVFRLNGVLIAEGDALAASVGLSATRWQVLGRLADAPATVSALARRRGLRRQSVRETVLRLERDGLVTRIPNPADRRAPLVQPTELGHRALEQIEPLRIQWAQRRASAVPRSELEQLRAALRRLRAGAIGPDPD